MEKDLIFRIENLNYAFIHEKTVIDLDRLDLEKGKIHLFVGPNGSGKTTLFKLLNGLYKYHSGSIFYKNTPFPEALSLIRRETVYVHQSPILFSGTVYRNIAMGLALRHQGKKEIEDRVKEVCSLLELDRFLYRKHRELSTGEVQRIALARAIAVGPEVLFLDEPTANMDDKSIRLTGDLLANLRKDSNVTVLLSSHNREFGEKICDTLYRLEQGRLIS